MVAPPPTVTTASERVNPAAPSTSQQSAATAAVLAVLAVGSGQVEHLDARRGARDHPLREVRQRAGVEDRDAATPSPSSRGQLAEDAVPITTSYGAGAGDVQHWSSTPQLTVDRRLDRRPDLPATTSSAPRPSVSTTSVATDS